MKTILQYILSTLLFISLFNMTFGQTFITITTCDTTITDPSTPFPLGSYVLTIKSASNVRLAYNVEQFNSNYGNVSFYDGLTTASPLITTLTDPLVLNQKFGGQTSGSAITITFFTAGPSSTLPHFKIKFRCVQTPTNYPIFQPLRSFVAGGNVQSGDYDNDGDLDLLIGGKIFRNDSYFDTAYKFERRPNVLDGWSSVKMCSADFDNDGFKDIFITGLTSVLGGIVSPQCAIYRNNGDGTFSRITTQIFAGAARGGCSIIDFNNDGKPDICYTGSTDYYQNTNRIFKIYLNNGNMNFSDANITLPGITGLIDASMSWADSDNDGDKDLVINGHDGNVNVARFFTRNGNLFTNMNLNLSNTSNGSISWVDVNMDGKPDIVNRGVATPDNIDAIIPEIFYNTGNNTFSRLVTNLPKLYGGGMDWIDYDGDLDMDVAINGVYSSGASDAAVYKNNGNGQFSRKNIDGAKGNSRIKWYDFNNDGKFDIILAGADITGSGGYFIKNMGADSFKISSFAFTANQYNEGAVVIDDFNNDGKIDVLTTGSLNDVDCNSNNSSTLVLGKDWRLSGIPKFTEVADLNNINPPTGTQYPDFFWTWGDYDSDGKLDVLASNEPENTYYQPESFLRMFKNNGNDNFSLSFNSQTTPLPSPAPYQVSYKQPIIMDIDNDGVNELFIPWNNTVYKRVNNQWQILYSDYQGTSSGGIVSCVAPGDYNNDGYIDVAIAWRDNTVGGGTGGGALTFYKNNGHGRLVFDTLNSSFNTSIREIKWGDIDNDGDIDLIVGNGAFENRNGRFTFINNQVTSMIHTATGDFNGDGFKDLINLSANQNFGSVKIQYNEQGTFFFKEYEHSFPNNTTGYGWSHSVLSFDVDNDGDDDIIFSAPLCNTGATILVNEGNFQNRLIHVISPNGGENISVNSVQNIKWYGNQIGGTVKIELSRDSGITWQTLSPSVTSSASGGNFNWLVTSPVSTKCLMKITDNSNITFSDKSNALFTISVPSTPVANAGNDTLICLGKSVKIGTTAVGNYLYSWTSSVGNFTSSVANPVVSPLTTTSYYLTVTNGSLSAKDTVVVIVSSVQANLPDTLLIACLGSSYSIGTTAQQGLSYQWSSIPAGFTSTMSDPTITPISNNVLYNLLVNNNATGCVANASVHVIADSCLGNGIIIYPNPANNQITIRYEQNTVFPNYFILLNSNGSIVLNKELLLLNTQIDLSIYLAGLYYYTIKTSTGQTLKSGSLVIIH